LAKKYDANGDGKINRSEWDRMKGEYYKRMAGAGGRDGGNPNSSKSGGINSAAAAAAAAAAKNTSSNPNTPPITSGGGGGGISGQNLITLAVLEYETENGRLPSSLQQLLDEEYLSSIPDPPPGMQWEINNQGEVASVPLY
jgi:hypothetical protein